MKKPDNFYQYFLAFLLILIIVGLIVMFIIYCLSEKIKEKEEKDSTILRYNITEKERARISLLHECMKAYNVLELPELTEEDEFYNNNLLKEKILSVLTLEINMNKGEFMEIFKDGFDLEEGEYACISYNSNEKKNIIKINDGIFYIPEN